MNEQVKNSIISAVTSTLMLLGAIPAVSALIPPEQFDALIKQIPGAVSAIGVLLTVGSFVYKLLPKSKESIVKGASEVPEVHSIVVAPNLAQKIDRPEVQSR